MVTQDTTQIHAFHHTLGAPVAGLATYLSPEYTCGHEKMWFILVFLLIYIYLC